jgi:hypothetical protein
VAQARAGTIAIFLVSLPVLVGVFIYGPFVLDLFLHRRSPARFLIPTGYVGWVRVEYQISNAPPLPREGRYLLVRLDKNGSLQTSSDLPEGWARDQFFYSSENSRQRLSNAGWCKGGMIWGEEVAAADHGGKVQKFFVGNEDQFRMEMDPAGKMFNPCG